VVDIIMQTKKEAKNERSAMMALCDKRMVENWKAKVGGPTNHTSRIFQVVPSVLVAPQK
jgi:hypothetical protein